MKKLLLLPLFALLLSCSGLMYSTRSFETATGIKAEALTLIKKANESYILHAMEAEALKAHVNQAYAHEKTRRMNHATVAMWSEIINSNGNLFALLDLWNTNDKLRPAMTVEASRQVERLLNSIIDLETHKK